MKTLLVPTDFSDAAVNATAYAFSLAKELKAKVVLVHIFHIPTVNTEAPVIIYSLDDLEKDNQNALEYHKQELSKRFDYTETIECIVRPGFLIEELKDIIAEQSVDLVVMGIKGSDFITEHLIGSNTVSAIKGLSCPVIAVPIEAAYRNIKNILFACDIGNQKNLSAFPLIKKITKSLGAKLHVLNIYNSENKPKLDAAESGIKVAEELDDTSHSLHFLEETDVPKAINHFADKTACDLILMLPKKHSFWTNLIHESNTEKMVFHTHTPLLTVHE